MKRITIERYELAMAEPTGYAGCIEGETDDGKRWIMWLDANGQPTVFWPRREDDGAVIGKGILLTRQAIETESRARMAKTREILDSGTPEEAVARMRAACDAAEAVMDGTSPSINAIKHVLAKATPEQEGGKPKQ